jgi:F-type H+-transporting ATPase subunit delta
MSPAPLHPELLGLADEYATAVLNLAQASGEEETVVDELDALAQMAEQVSGLEGFLASPFIRPEQKQSAMDKALAGQVSTITGNLLGVLIRNGRGALLSLLAARCRHMLNHREGRIEVLVRSAQPLDEPVQRELKAALQQLLKAEPMLTLELDEDLLGGLQVEVGDEIIDASLASQLKRLRSELLSRRFTAQNS